MATVGNDSNFIYSNGIIAMITASDFNQCVRILLIWLNGNLAFVVHVTLQATITNITILFNTLCFMFVYPYSLNIKYKTIKRMGCYFVQDIVFRIINYNGQIMANTFISTRHIQTNNTLYDEIIDVIFLNYNNRNSLIIVLNNWYITLWHFGASDDSLFVVSESIAKA